MPADSEWMTWPEAAELVGCPVPTIDWWTHQGRIEKRPFAGNRPTLKRSSVEEFAAWYSEREAQKQEKREHLAERSRQHFQPPDPTGWMSLDEAAGVLQVKPRHVGWLVERGFLRATRTRSRIWAEAASVEERRAQLSEDRERWVSRVEAARIIGCGTSTIQRAVRAGRSRAGMRRAAGAAPAAQLGGGVRAVAALGRGSPRFGRTSAGAPHSQAARAISAPCEVASRGGRNVELPRGQWELRRRTKYGHTERGGT